jgi:hypothetical protein
MTAEDHLRLLIGDLVLTVARLSAENDALRAAAPAPPAPAPEPASPRHE